MSNEQIGLNYEATVENQNDIRKLKERVQRLENLVQYYASVVDEMKEG